MTHGRLKHRLNRLSQVYKGTIVHRIKQVKKVFTKKKSEWECSLISERLSFVHVEQQYCLLILPVQSEYE